MSTGNKMGEETDSALEGLRGTFQGLDLAQIPVGWMRLRIF